MSTKKRSSSMISYDNKNIMKEIARRKKLFFENKLFKSYGHTCEILEEIDVIYKTYPGTGWLNRFQRFLISLFTISESNPMTKKYISSQSSLRNSKVQHIELDFFMIHPFSIVTKCWDYWMAFVTIIAIFFLPFYCTVMYLLVSKPKAIPPNSALFPGAMELNALISFSFFANIIAVFSTAYHDREKNEIYFSRTTAAKMYLKSWFIFDVIIACRSRFWLVFVHIQTLNIGEMLLQLTIIFHANRYLDPVSNFNISSTKKQFFRLIFYFLLFLHWYGTITLLTSKLQMIWFGKKKLEMDLHMNEIDEINYWDYWLAAISQSISITTRTGKGVFVFHPPFLQMQILQWVIATAFIQFITASIVVLLRGKYGHRFKSTDIYLQIEVYMNEKNLPRPLCDRIWTYYKYRYNKSFFNESKIMNAISGRLRQDIIMHRCRRLLEQVSFFKGMPLTFFVRLVICLKPEYYVPNDVIIRAKTSARSMYFISSGTVAVIAPDGKEVCHLYDGNHFGEVSLVMPNQLRTASVVAVEMCKLYKLLRSDFLRTITPFPDLLAQIESVAHNRMEALDYLSREIIE